MRMLVLPGREALPLRAHHFAVESLYFLFIDEGLS